MRLYLCHLLCLFYIRARELEDNMQLKSTQEEIQKIEKKINDVKRELKKFGEHQDLVT